ncbi:GvpL/GvpF family gas vesicle protein [Spirillospora sp. NPDC029432]|uniref:GvpL/GvpF family gas vesicle protein n=1 Tax=Spirillospora sp. NPDC029432 TaxID=3154599 RepID=UPI0034531525
MSTNGTHTTATTAPAAGGGPGTGPGERAEHGAGRGAGAETAVYLYGVARDLPPAALGETTGVGGAAVRRVSAAGLTALVSTVRLDQYGEEALRANLEDLRFLEDTARAHHDVVDLAARAAPTAPVRIATLYRDDDRVAAVLAERHEQFTQALDAITGRSEWGVKAYAHAEAYDSAPTDPEAEPGSGSAGDGGTGGGGVGTAYLRQRQAQRRRQQDATRHITAQAEAVHAELATHAAASRSHPPQDPRLSGHAGTLILNTAYLVDDEQVPGFLAVTAELDGRLTGIEVQVTGPWPAYSFIDTADTGGPRNAS